MAKRRQCARCGEFNAITAKECKDCGAQFSASAADSEKPRKRATTCSFDHEGRTCGHLGIFSAGTNGESAWYCREHWEVINGRRAKGQGNEIVESPKSLAIIERNRDWVWDAEQRRYVPRHAPMAEERAA